MKSNWNKYFDEISFFVSILSYCEMRLLLWVKGKRKKREERGGAWKTAIWDWEVELGLEELSGLLVSEKMIHGAVGWSLNCTALRDSWIWRTPWKSNWFGQELVPGNASKAGAGKSHHAQPTWSDSNTSIYWVSACVCRSVFLARLLNAHPGLDLTEVWARAAYFCLLPGLDLTQSEVRARQSILNCNFCIESNYLCWHFYICQILWNT